MPKVQCSFPDCPYTTDDLPAELVLKLLDIHTGSHATPPQPTVKIERVRRPSISSAGTSEEWQYFQTRWGEYVAATKISGTDRVIQLLECCDDQLRKDLTRAAGKSLTTQSEEEVLRAIKRLAVREENIMVARVALHDMRQDNDETIRSFSARIRGQANVCQYNTACPSCSTTVDFTDCILRDVLARGIADNEIQLDLLGDAKQDMTLEEMLKFVESKESGKRSASRLHDYFKGPQQQQLAPTIGCDGRPTKTAQHLLMENTNSALIVARKVMDLSHQPASGEVNAQHLITRANTVTAYITSRPFVAAKIKPSQHLRADQQTHHAHQPPRQMKMQSSLTIPSLTIPPTELSSIHSAPCPHQQLTTVANVLSAWTTTPTTS